jgi:hypothetical protein
LQIAALTKPVYMPLFDTDHKISLKRSIEMTSLYRKNKEKILLPDVLGKNILPISETFNREAIDRLLAQPNCAGLRIYYSMDESLKLHAIIVGVDEANKDILPSSTESKEGDDDGGEIVEDGVLCPPNCLKDPSPLNT